MKKHLVFCVAAMTLLLACLSCARDRAPNDVRVAAAADSGSPRAGETYFAEETKKHLQNQEVVKYYEEHDVLATSLCALTGKAVSPLLTSGVLGAYKYLKTPDEAKHLMPWYCKPWFWVTCLVLFALVFFPSVLSDFFHVPPFFAAFFELLNKKIGLLLVSPIILDSAATLVKQLTAAEPVASIVDKCHVFACCGIPWEGLSWLPQSFLASPIAPKWFFGGVYGAILFAAIVPLLAFAFFAVWLLNYAFDVLMLLSPFGWLDLLLKITRGIFLFLLLIIGVFSPQLIYFILLPLILFSMLLFGWSIRRAIMALIFFRYLIFGSSNSLSQKGVLAFSRNIRGIKKNSVGRLIKRNGELVFSYRRFFLFQRNVVIEPSKLEPVHTN